MRRGLVAAVALATVAAGAGVRAEDAAACSCVKTPAAALVARADAAFVGTVRSREPGVVSFDVERVAKGTLPRTLEVATETSSASCGLEVEPGSRIGLVLERDGRAWRGNLCGEVGAADLAAASVPGAGFATTESDDGRPVLPIVLAAGAAAMAAAAGLALWRRRASRPPATGSD